MGELSRGVRGLLAHAVVYNFFDFLIGGPGARARLVAQYVRIGGGDRVLDIGCGPGTMLAYLPSVEYLGFDASEAYIAAARARYGGRGTFVCGRVEMQRIPHEAYFDVVLAIGILHHLDNAGALDLFRLARRALKPGGRLITFDGCFVDGQSPLARWIISKDRGQNVRTRDEYVECAQRVFSDVAVHLRYDLLRIPYTHMILDCKNI